jgi:hypothetical protein
LGSHQNVARRFELLCKEAPILTEKVAFRWFDVRCFVRSWGIAEPYVAVIRWVDCVGIVRYVQFEVAFVGRVVNVRRLLVYTPVVKSFMPANGTIRNACFSDDWMIDHLETRIYAEHGRPCGSNFQEKFDSLIFILNDRKNVEFANSKYDSISLFRKTQGE